MVAVRCPHPKGCQCPPRLGMTLTSEEAAAKRPHVDIILPATGGSVSLQSCSGGLEAVWVRLHDEEGQQVAFDRATGQHLAAPVRLTPREARKLSDVLRAYADSHPIVGEESEEQRDD